MTRRLRIITFIICCLSLSMYAKEHTVALQSSEGGRIIIKYNETIDKDGIATINILNVQKKLVVENDKHLDRIRVLFFDKSGGYKEDQFVSDIDTEALMVPSDELSYNRSVDGIVWLDEHPELKIKLLKGSGTLSIPVYIAYYVKKHKYKIMASCGEWVITLDTSKQHDASLIGANGKVTRTITTTEEIEDCPDLSDSEVADILINRIEDLIDHAPADRLPEGLEFYVGQLREIEFKIKDVRLKSRIADLLVRVESKKNEVESYASQLRTRESSDIAAKAEEKEARSNLDYLNERLENISNLNENDVAEMKVLANELRRKSHAVSDSQLATEMKDVADRCDEEMKKIEDSKKRRNIWMILGGIFLGFLMLVGNQTVQHFRNLRNQRNILEMQEKLAKQAQDDTKRRIRGLAYNKMAKTRNAVRGNVTRKVEKGVDSLSKGKGKKVSI